MPRIDHRLAELAAGPGRPSDRGLDPCLGRMLPRPPQLLWPRGDALPSGLSVIFSM